PSPRSKTRERNCRSGNETCSRGGWLALESLGQAFRCGVAPGCGESLPHDIDLRRGQIDVCIPAPTPSALHRSENFRITLDKMFLFFWRQLYDRPIFVGIPKRCEYLPANANIGVMHVR